MKESGENVVRIDFDYIYLQRKEYRGLESKPGVLNREQVEKIDTVFRLAAKHGIRVHVVPFVTSPPMWESWKSLNPYVSTRNRQAQDAPVLRSWLEE